MDDANAMTVSQQQPATAPPKKRFIGKAKAEALRRQALLQKEKQDGISSIEDGVVALKGCAPSCVLFADQQRHHREVAEW